MRCSKFLLFLVRFYKGLHNYFFLGGGHNLKKIVLGCGHDLFFLGGGVVIINFLKASSNVYLLIPLRMLCVIIFMLSTELTSGKRGGGGLHCKKFEGFRSFYKRFAPHSPFRKGI